MLHVFWTGAALSLCALSGWAATGANDDEGAPVEVAAVELAETERRVELAICLDTSGSMEKLIDACRQKLWTIVNDLALAEPTPELRVALLTFGNDGQDANAGWVKVFSELTTDLDMISLHLFAQKTNGGTELVGRVVQAAVDELEWTKDPRTLKLIFVAGNESADQDQEVSFRDACKKAIENDIQVNSIYCGNPDDELAPVWQEVAMRADGHYAAIDHQGGTVVIESPFDEELVKLNDELNATYIPIGERGRWSEGNQVAQDRNAASANSAALAGRARSKASKLYVCSWDLCDALAMQQIDWEKLEDKDLPENMRAMTLEQRKAYVDEKRKAREAVQKKIEAVAKKRDAFVAAEMRRLALDDKNSFDNAVRRAVRSQAEAKGFTFAEPVHASIEEEVTEEEVTEEEAGVESSTPPAGSGGARPVPQSAIPVQQGALPPQRIQQIQQQRVRSQQVEQTLRQLEQRRSQQGQQQGVQQQGTPPAQGQQQGGGGAGQQSSGAGGSSNSGTGGAGGNGRG